MVSYCNYLKQVQLQASELENTLNTGKYVACYPRIEFAST